MSFSALPVRVVVAFLAIVLFLPCTGKAVSLTDHVLYAEALGKGGLWGLGYDALFHPDFGMGAAGSFYTQDGRRIFSLSPYLSFYPMKSGANRWLVHAGPQFLRETTVSPVPEWSGMSSNHFGGEISTGYEYRAGWLLRAYGMLSIGKDGFAPWVGLSVGIPL